MMTLRTYQDDEGRKRYALGPVEIAIVVSIPTLLLSLLVWLGSAMAAQLDVNSVKMDRIDTQQAVMTSELKTITKQLETLPEMAKQVAVNTLRHATTERRLDRLEKH